MGNLTMFVLNLGILFATLSLYLVLLCQMHYTYSMSSKTVASHCHVQLGLQDKYRAIKVLVVYNSWDLEPLDLLNSQTLKLVVTNRPLRYES